jgi:hypothetical protein
VAVGGRGARGSRLVGVGADWQSGAPGTQPWLPGEPLYRSFGFREIERFTLTMPDGVSVEAVAMERPIDALPLGDTAARAPGRTVAYAKRHS